MWLNLTFQSIFLGILQGVTEFLPVSSSGHLVIAQQFFPNINESPLLLNIILHLGTLLALVIYFFKDIVELFRKPRNLLLIIIASFITAVLVFPFKGVIEELFFSPKIASLLLILTAAILFFASQHKINFKKDLSLKEAAGIGFFQALAVLPGISRSGITIATGIFFGLETMLAFKFSFLLAIPTIAGAGLLELREINKVSSSMFVAYGFGFIFAFLSGFWAINFLIKKVAKNQKNLLYFSAYCLVVGSLTFFFL